METTQVQSQDTYAGFWARGAAYFLDMGFTTFFILQVYNLFREEVYFTMFDRLDRMLKYMHIYIIVLGLIFNWFYFAGFESSYLKATPGKRLLGLYVTDELGQRISFGQASGRYFGKIISGLILGIGYIMAGFTDRKQALHDSMANCLVWKK